jgi:hypothetical protein
VADRTGKARRIQPDCQSIVGTILGVVMLATVVGLLGGLAFKLMHFVRQNIVT